MHKWGYILGLTLLCACSRPDISSEDLPDPQGKSDSDGEGAGSSTPTPDRSGDAERTHHTVLVIDRGFVLDHPVFENKIAGSYTLRCTDYELLSREFPSFAARKQDYLANVSKYQNNCTLNEGIPQTASPGFQQIAPVRNSWNQAIQTKRLNGSFPYFADVESIVGGEDIETIYHGTNTASLVAFQNPKVKLVVVENSNIRGGNPLDHHKCTTAQTMQQLAQLYQDQEVFEATLSAGPSSRLKLLEDLSIRHAVTLANHSYGPPSNLKLQELNRQLNCPYQPDYAPLMQIGADFDRRLIAAFRERGLLKFPHLDVFAAGNDGAPMNQIGDTFDCQNLDEYRLYVGALDSRGNLAEFTNHGKCVSMYTLGEDVVVAAPRGFLHIQSGTSFSAPLAVRHMSLNLDPNLTPQMMTEQAVALAANGVIPLQQLPAELAYNVPNPISGFALSSSERPTPAPQHGKLTPLPSP